MNYEQLVFERYCLVPGTRCNDIMQRIARGESDEEIARRYPSPGDDDEREHDAKRDNAVIAVYRKAYNGALSGSDKPLTKQEKIWAMHKAGMDYAEIAEAMGTTKKHVYDALKSQRLKLERQLRRMKGK